MAKVKDLTGMKFGRWTVIERAENRGTSVCWLCKCECGNEKVVHGGHLKNGKTTSCGCVRKESVSKANTKDLTGMTFGKLIVIERAGSDKHRHITWKCKCECGEITNVSGSRLLGGITTSCGCTQKEMISKMSKQQKGKNNPCWKGGTTVILGHLRRLQIVEQWRKNTYVNQNYRCELTGKKVHSGNSNIHHLKSFNTIVKEAHELHGIEIKPLVKDYTEEELSLLEKYVESWHVNTENGVVLCNELHILFHSLYGKGNNTVEQYIEFKERYLAGEFKEILK